MFSTLVMTYIMALCIGIKVKENGKWTKKKNEKKGEKEKDKEKGKKPKKKFNCMLLNGSRIGFKMGLKLEQQEQVEKITPCNNFSCTPSSSLKVQSLKLFKVHLTDMVFEYVPAPQIHSH